MNIEIKETIMQYGNFTEANFKNVIIEDSNISSGSLSEVKFKNVNFKNADFSNSQFFRTKLTGIDFSGSNISGIVVGIEDLKGAIVNELQALELANLLGIKIKKSY